jgi:hypothetical protein
MAILEYVREALKDAQSRAGTLFSTGQLPPEQRALKAIRVPCQEEYVRALGLLERLSTEVTIEYEVAIDNIIILPRWSYDSLIPLLKTEAIAYEDAEVRSFRDLPPERQAELRGLQGRRG